MTDSNELTPTGVAVIAAEVLPGLWLAWRLLLSGRARPPARLAEWRISTSEFLAFLGFSFFGAFAVSAIAGFLLKSLPARLGATDPTVTAVIGNLAMDLGLLVGIAGFHAIFSARNRPELPSLGPSLRSGLITFLVTMPPVLAASFLSSQILHALHLPEVEQDALQVFDATHGVLRGAFILMAVLFAPLTEELIFRAGLFRFLRSRIWRPAAILLPALLFGALHVSGQGQAGLPAVLPLTVLAVVFSLAYERTGSIGTTIVAHCLFNLNTFILMAAGIAT